MAGLSIESESSGGDGTGVLAPSAASAAGRLFAGVVSILLAVGAYTIVVLLTRAVPAELLELARPGRGAGR